MYPLESCLDKELQRLAESGNLRVIPTDSTYEPAVTDLSTNDYLGLAMRSDLRDEFYSEPDVRNIPMTSAAARLLASTQIHYDRLEQQLRSLYGRDILLFNSGYHANTGMIPVLAHGRTLIAADRLVHASIIDGIILSKCRFTRFPHNDFDALEKIIVTNIADYDRILVAVESIYSMDGDRADIRRLIELKRRYPGVILYVDEAHAFGVEGDRGLGLVSDADTDREVDVVIGTFGKACASMGAFCATSQLIRNFAVNKARSFIFSTAIPPLTAAWTGFMIDKITGMDAERSHLKHISKLLADGITSLTGRLTEPSHIIPVITGDPVKAVEISSRLMIEGYKVLPIRVPTVPPGTDRLRISLSAGLTETDITGFLTKLSQIL